MINEYNRFQCSNNCKDEGIYITITNTTVTKNAEIIDGYGISWEDGETQPTNGTEYTYACCTCGKEIENIHSDEELINYLKRL